MECKLDSISDKYNQLNFSCGIHYTHRVEMPISGDSKVTSTSSEESVTISLEMHRLQFS